MFFPDTDTPASEQCKTSKQISSQIWNISFEIVADKESSDSAGTQDTVSGSETGKLNITFSTRG